ncbi:DNA-directed RNA polymerase [Aspergillus sclerotialis]|uniref:DNA-directed RNA polymerase subunit n=1 Tax=Aspergillus sclerotialis TaxID=2070753 RepID=A0A3A2ZV30_9EURO|nr:DNA-directed RNA polymerase [Aspergillus sclerotialis]
MASSEVPEGALTKHQVTSNTPKIITGLQFGVQASHDIVNQSVVELSNRKYFDLERQREPIPNGPLDKRMGTRKKDGVCLTCGGLGHKCNGHFGYLKLALPVFHAGYFKQVFKILWAICKNCSSILLPEEDRRAFLEALRRPRLDDFRRCQIVRRITEQCRRVRKCKNCGGFNGKVVKVAALKIVHERFSKPGTKSDGQDIDAYEDLHALRVFNIFRKISTTDCELLGINPDEARPENLIWQVLPAPPVCIRLSVELAYESREDDLTVKLGDIIQSNNALKAGILAGLPVFKLAEAWESLQLQIAMYITGKTPGSQWPEPYKKPLHCFYQRLKGKEGRFRSNLSGKRVDYSGRTVISPDPNLRIDEVGIPVHVAKKLTYPEVVTAINKERLQQRILNGEKKWPGALAVTKKQGGYRQLLKYGNLQHIASTIQIGDIVERHLEDRDIVLFNRQPSLHKLSILYHSAKIHLHRTFCLNECVCHPYNADFDGDEMNIHIPQTEEARAEALELMGVRGNLVTPKNGKPIIGAIQDFISTSYILSWKDTFLDRASFAQICFQMLETGFDLPPPSILKPQSLWTGKQVFNVLMRPNKNDPVLVNIDTPCRHFRAAKGQPNDLSSNDAWLVIRNSELMCGVMDKSIVGPGKKGNLFYAILRGFGPAAAAECMNRISRLSARWLTNIGFSFGISDVYPSESLTELKNMLIDNAFAEYEDVIADHVVSSNSPEMKKLQNTENRLSRILTKVRQQAGNECINQLSKYSALLIMAMAGSKGSDINISQMTALVGQQVINNKRVQNGFEGRTLPHFLRNTLDPLSKGFIQNSFFTGLSPTEMFFHAASGREGLLDTAIKTAETGYMSRRLVKSLEDLSCQYDNTIRNSAGEIVQFQYGDDCLDPVEMEGTNCPVHFERTFTHAIATSNNPGVLYPSEIMRICEEELLDVRQKLARKGQRDSQLQHTNCTEDDIDHLESVRMFLNSIADFVQSKADKLVQPNRSIHSLILNLANRISEEALRKFIQLCLSKYEKAKLQPGYAVGAIAAQSIGEPGTQMTLNTFHFAGVSGMNLTQGVPRIKEIVNALVEIRTPVITCILNAGESLQAAQFVKGTIERTYLRDIVSYVKEVWDEHKSYIKIKINWRIVDSMLLDLSIQDILWKIKENRYFCKAKDLTFTHPRSKICIHMDMNPHSKTLLPKSHIAQTTKDPYIRLRNLRSILLGIQVSGYKDVRRVIIRARGPIHTLLVEGNGLHSCLRTEGIDPTLTSTNSVMETKNVLGIEAARLTIIKEISEVMKDLDIDTRHIQLLADVMTYKGEVLGITRFGLAKTRDSVLQLSSFEQSAENLFEAGAAGKIDAIRGVSESIIMGKPVGLGTGVLGVRQVLKWRKGDFKKKKTVFEDVWRETHKSFRFD